MSETFIEGSSFHSEKIYAPGACRSFVFPYDGGDYMNTPGLSIVRVDVDKALATIKGNRKKHEDQYRRAYRGWLQEAIEQYGDFYSRLDDELNSNEIGPLETPRFDLPPNNHLGDYDRVIAILEWTEDPVIELTQQEFDMYIRDEWAWKQNFAVSASKYGA